MTRYAARTKVPVGNSIGNIRQTLERYGGDAFGYAEEAGHAMINFRADGRFVRMVIEYPTAQDPEIAFTDGGKHRSEGSRREAIEQAKRQRWRALLLIVKAKLEAVESEIVTFDEEFLAYLVMPDGTTVGDVAVPQIAAAYETGKMPMRLLPESIAVRSSEA